MAFAVKDNIQQQRDQAKSKIAPHNINGSFWCSTPRNLSTINVLLLPYVMCISIESLLRNTAVKIVVPSSHALLVYRIAESQRRSAFVNYSSKGPLLATESESNFQLLAVACNIPYLCDFFLTPPPNPKTALRMEEKIIITASPVNFTIRDHWSLGQFRGILSVLTANRSNRLL